MQVKDIFVFFEDVTYFFKSVGSLADLESKAKKLMPAYSPSEILFFFDQRDGVEQLTVANFTDVCEGASNGRLFLLAEVRKDNFLSEPVSRKSSIGTNSGSSSDGISFGRMRVGPMSRHSPSSVSSTASDSGPLFARLLATAHDSISAVHLRDHFSLSRFQVLCTGHYPLLGTLTLDRLAGNSERWMMLVGAVANAQNLRELRLIAPAAATEIVAGLCAEMLMKPSANTLVIHKAVISSLSGINWQQNLTELCFSSLLVEKGNLRYLSLSQSIRKLTLSKCGIGFGAEIGSILERLVNLQSLDLYGNNLGVEAVEKVSTALRRMQKLKSLNLGKNNIRDAGVGMLARHLREAPLEQLKLSWSAACHFYLLNAVATSVRLLDLSHNRIDHKSFQIFSDMISHLSALEDLRMAGCGLTVDEYSLLIAGPAKGSLLALDLSQNAIGPYRAIWTGIAYRFPNIRSLRLASIGSSLSGLLSDAPFASELTELSLSGNAAERDAIFFASFAKMRNLRELRLVGCEITSTAKVRLPDSICVLDLSHSTVATTDAFPSCVSFGKLTRLSLRGCGLHEGTAKTLFQSLYTAAALRTLDLSYNCLETGSFKLFPSLSSLSSLKVAHNRLNTPAEALFSKLSIQAKLRKLDVSGNQLSFSFLFDQSSSIAVEKINLNNNPLGLFSCGNVPEVANRFVQTFPKLCSMKLGNCDLGVYLRPLVQGLQCIPWLQVLSLSGNSLSGLFKARGEQFPDLPCLRTVKLANVGGNAEKIATFLDSLSSAKGLQEVNLSDNNLGTEGIAAIARNLCSFSCIRTLNLSGNNISEIPYELITALQGFQYLQKLDLSRNAFEAWPIIQLWMLATRKLLAQLRRLNLAHNRIPNKGALFLSRMMQACPSLVALDVSYNLINSSYVSLLQTTALPPVVLPPLD